MHQPQSPASPEVRLSPGAATLLLTRFSFTVFLFCLVIGVSLPVIPLYVHEVLGFNLVWVGFAVGIQFLATVLTRRYAGRVCDETGPKIAQLRGLGFGVVSAVALFGATLFTGAPAVQLAFIIAGRLLLGIGESLLITGALSWGIASLGPLHSGRVMSWTGASIFAALSAGAPLGVWMFHTYTFTSLVLLCAVLPILSLVNAWPLPGTAPLHAGQERTPYRAVVSMVWRHGMILGLQTVGFAAIGAFVVLYFQSEQWDGAGLALSAYGIAFVAIRMLCASFPDRFGPVKVARVSMVTQFVGLLTLCAAPIGPVALVGAAMTGIGASLVFPAMGSEVVKRVPASVRGTSLGTFAAFSDIAILVTGPAAGAIASHFGYRAVFLVSGGASMIALGMLWFSKVRCEHRATAEAVS